VTLCRPPSIQSVTNDLSGSAGETSSDGNNHNKAFSVSSTTVYLTSFTQKKENP